MPCLVSEPSLSSGPRPARLPPESGTTLIEILIAIMVLGIGVTALVGGLISSISASNVHRDAATRDTIIRSYAEQLKFAIEGQITSGGSWCAVTSSTVISGYAVSQAPDPCPSAGAPQFQTVTLTVSSLNGGGAESMQIVVRQP